MDGPVGVPLVLIGACLALLVYGGVHDLLTFTIPNWVSAGLGLTFLLAAAATGAAPLTVAAHVGVAVAAFAVAAGLFHFGLFGGGDVKLLAATALWTGAGGIMPLLLLVSLFGGVLTLAQLAGRLVPARWRAPCPAIDRLCAGQDGVPYGVAIAAGAGTLFLAMPEVAGGVVAGLSAGGAAGGG